MYNITFITRAQITTRISMLTELFHLLICMKCIVSSNYYLDSQIESSLGKYVWMHGSETCLSKTFQLEMNHIENSLCQEITNQ